MITNTEARTNVHEIAAGIYRINTPIDLPDGQGFSFNQYLVLDDEPLLWHTGPRRLFPLVRDAVAALMPVGRLRHVGLSHVEADECGSLDLWLAMASQAAPLCSRVAGMVSVGDWVDRAPRTPADGELIPLGTHTLCWHDTPHLPHGWDCGLVTEVTTGTLLCGDLFTQPGHGTAPLVSSDILGPSESFRAAMDYFAHAPRTAPILQGLAQLNPTTLACMHGHAWRGNGGALLRELAGLLEAPSLAAVG